MTNAFHPSHPAPVNPSLKQFDTYGTYDSQEDSGAHNFVLGNIYFLQNRAEAFSDQKTPLYRSPTFFKGNSVWHQLMGGPRLSSNVLHNFKTARQPQGTISSSSCLVSFGDAATPLKAVCSQDTMGNVIIGNGVDITSLPKDKNDVIEISQRQTKEKDLTVSQQLSHSRLNQQESDRLLSIKKLNFIINNLLNFVRSFFDIMIQHYFLSVSSPSRYQRLFSRSETKRLTNGTESIIPPSPNSNSNSNSNSKKRERANVFTGSDLTLLAQSPLSASVTSKSGTTQVEVTSDTVQENQSKEGHGTSKIYEALREVLFAKCEAQNQSQNNGYYSHIEEDREKQTISYIVRQDTSQGPSVAAIESKTDDESANNLTPIYSAAYQVQDEKIICTGGRDSSVDASQYESAFKAMKNAGYKNVKATMKLNLNQNITQGQLIEIEKTISLLLKGKSRCKTNIALDLNKDQVKFLTQSTVYQEYRANLEPRLLAATLRVKNEAKKVLIDLVSKLESGPSKRMKLR